MSLLVTELLEQTSPCLLIIVVKYSVGRESEHAPPWGESSPDDYRYANQIYTDPREREKEQHDMNKR